MLSSVSMVHGNSLRHDCAMSTDMRFKMSRAIIASIAAVFAILSIVWVFRSYSPVPQDDDWTGYLGFYADLVDGKYSAWFAHFLGHRPILPRVLYWLDIRYFGGRFVFLIAAN